MYKIYNFSLSFILIVACIVLASNDLYSQTEDNNNLLINASKYFSFSEQIKKTSDAVVGITAEKIVTRSQPTLVNDSFFKQFFNNDLIPIQKHQKTVNHALGSGVIVHKSGLVVTSYHVIEGADQIHIQLKNLRIYPADIQMSDPSTDLAVLKIRNPIPAKLTIMPLGNSDNLDVGDIVLAIGNPYGFGQSVSTGIVSALSRPLPQFSNYSSFIQTDAGIHPGNSGGALINIKGQLIGINTAIFTVNGGYQGIGFAVPSRLVSRAIDASLKKQPFLKSWLGLTGENVVQEDIKKYNLEYPTGVVVNKIIKNSPASHSGLQPRDIIISVDKRNIINFGHLTHRIATYKPGEKVIFSLLRKGQMINIDFTTEYPPLIPAPQYWHGLKFLLGATFANISPAIAQQLAIPEYYRGTAVIAIVLDSYASRIGIRRGDVITKLNNQPITTTMSLRDALNDITSKRILLEYIHKNNQIKVSINLP